MTCAPVGVRAQGLSRFVGLRHHGPVFGYRGEADADDGGPATRTSAHPRRRTSRRRAQAASRRRRPRQPAAQPGWEGTPLDRHLLAPVPAPGALTPITTQVVEGLRRLGRPDGTAGLFGWDPVPGGPAGARGLAWAARVTSGGSTLVAALVVDDTRQLRLIASGTVPDGTTALPLGPWSLALGGRIDGTLDVRWAADGPPTITGAAPGSALRAELRRPAPPGPATGPIDLGAVTLAAGITVRGADRVDPTALLRIADGALRLAPGGLAALVPELAKIPIDVDIAAEAGRGVTIGAPTLRIQLPKGLTLPGLELGPLQLGLAVRGRSVVVDLRTSLALNLAGLPLRLAVDGLGLAVPFSLGDGDRLGFDPEEIAGALPKGAGISIALPVVSATGRVIARGNGSFVGVLAARVPPLSASALGALAMDPLSFVAILAATFPPPGIQIGLRSTRCDPRTAGGSPSRGFSRASRGFSRASRVPDPPARPPRRRAPVCAAHRVGGVPRGRSPRPSPVDRQRAAGGSGLE